MDVEYPKLYDQEQVNSFVNQSKCKNIIGFLDTCKKDLKRYKKLAKRYSIANNAVKYISYTVLTASEISGIILAVLGTSGILVPVIIGASGFVETLISALISDGILSRKKEHYKAICNKIEIFISKFYHFTNRSLADEIITKEELDECEILQKEYNNILNNHREVIKTENKNVNILIENQLKLIQKEIKEMKKLK